MSIIPIGRPLRVGMVGVGKIFELTSRAYTTSEDAEVVAVCDPVEERLGLARRTFPGAECFTGVGDLLASGAEIDMVEIGVPTPMHCEVACRFLRAGYHVNLQKPMATSLIEADEMITAAREADVVLRVMEPYLFFQPLEVLKQVVESGEIGEVAGFHMKMVGTGGGGWDVPWSTLEWQFSQMEQQGLGILVFDDGWHKFSVARWLFGPVVDVMAWVGRTEFGSGVAVDAPSTIMWNHANGVRGVFDLVLAPDTFMRSDYYSSDERFEVTGTRGFVRVNHCAAYGLEQQPSLEVYRDGVLRPITTSTTTGPPVSSARPSTTFGGCDTARVPCSSTPGGLARSSPSFSVRWSRRGAMPPFVSTKSPGHPRSGGHRQGDLDPRIAEEAELPGQRVLPDAHFLVEVRAVAVLARVFELVEGGVLGIEKLAVLEEEVVVDGLGHVAPPVFGARPTRADVSDTSVIRLPCLGASSRQRAGRWGIDEATDPRCPATAGSPPHVASEGGRRLQGGQPVGGGPQDRLGCHEHRQVPPHPHPAAGESLLRVELAP
jgi:predicted dehydrogenase